MSIGTFNAFVVLDAQSFTTNTGLNNNVVLTSSDILVTPTTSGDTITGFAPPRSDSGGRVTVANADTVNKLLVLSGDHASSLALNRLKFPLGVSNITLGPQETATFTYENGVGWRARLGPQDSEVVPLASDTAPPAIGTQALGASTRYARQDHNHGPDPQTAVNTGNIASNTTTINTHTSQISTLQGQTAGIPALSNSTPPAIAAAGSAGVATTASRSDHTHQRDWVASNTVATALAVSAAAGVSAELARVDHAHPLPAWAVNTPARTLGSAGFQPSTTKYTLCLYTVSISATTTIGGGQDGNIELRSDSGSTPTTVRATARLRQVATLAVALQLDQNQTQQLIYLVPPGHFVRLVGTQTVGAPTLSLVSSVEIVFG